MDISQILTMAGKMFPGISLDGVIQQAKEATQGTPDTLAGVSAAAKRLGISQSEIDAVFQKYGGTMQARALCAALGTTPEALKADAEKIVGGGGNSVSFSPAAPSQNSTSKRFPRLK